MNYIKRFTSLLIVVIALSTISTKATDIATLKGAISSQLLSNNPNDSIVCELASRLFPDGVDTDQCLMELVAHALPTDEDIERLMTTIKADGSWDGIYYTSPARSAWEAQAHIKNIMKLARGYRSSQSKFYNDPKTLECACRAIDYWCRSGHTCPNWWYNAIGVPKVFAPALLLLEGAIPQELMEEGIKILLPAEREMTGQNKVWLNGVTLIKGLLLNDEEIVARTSAAIREELRLSREEGIQYDYSYHQHGAMQQFGNYGLAFASSMSYWMRIFNGTKYDFSPTQKSIMRDYMTRGLNVTIWRGYMDVSSCGRQLFDNSQGGKAASLLISNMNMMHVDESAKEDYEAYISRNYTSPDKNNLVGNFSFPISKYTIHRGEDFLFSVKMFSSRILGGEVTNRENLKGYHLADGATMIYRTGAEYDNIFAYWDGKYMPGTTVEINDKELKVLKNDRAYVNGSDFVGCISYGNYGLSAMEYRRDGVKANKTYLFFGDEILCLGNSISAESGDELLTTLNQCKHQESTLLASKKDIIQAKKGQEYSSKRVYSDGVGYESLDERPIEFTIREQIGYWRDIADFMPLQEMRGDVFTAQVKGGESYAYVIKPSAQSEAFLKGQVKNRFRILQNSSIATAAESTDKELVMVVFWSAGTVKTKAFGTVEATAPIMVLLSREEGKVIEKVYDPLESGAKVNYKK